MIKQTECSFLTSYTSLSVSSFRQTPIEFEGDVTCEEGEIVTEAVKVEASSYQPVEAFVHTLYGNSDYYQIKRILAQIEPRFRQLSFFYFFF